MLCVCICLTVALAVQLVIGIIDSIKAKKVADELLSEVGGITKPSEEEAQNTSPITLWGDNNKKPIGETTTPETEPSDIENSEYFSEWLANIREMKKKYPDFKGYIQIENLDILYPILQTDNNDYYIDHIIDGSKNKSGEIFMDYRNNATVLTDNQNIVLYGHNLGDGTKFHNLTDLRKENNFYNSPINIITEEGIFTFTIFSFYKTDNNENFTPITFDYYSNFGMFCMEEQAKSMHASDFKFTGKELILTLSTCVNDFGGRWCTHAVLTNISH